MMFGHPFGATNNRAAGSSDRARRPSDGIVKNEMLGKEGSQVAGGLEFKRASASSSLDHLVQQQRSLLGGNNSHGNLNISNLNLPLPHSNSSGSSPRAHQQVQLQQLNAHRGDGSDSAASDGSSSGPHKAFPTLKHRARADFQQALNQAEQANLARSNSQSSSPKHEDQINKVKQETATKPKKQSITPATVPMSFPQKLMKLLDDEKNAEIISWLPHGKAFLIFQKKRFEKEIMPTLFKQSKFTSFTRKLNRWGFQRVRKGPEAGAYYHKFFKRGQPRLSMQMCCQKLPNEKDDGPHMEDDYNASDMGGLGQMGMMGGMNMGMGMNMNPAQAQMAMERRLQAQRNMQAQMMDAGHGGQGMMDPSMNAQSYIAAAAKRQHQVQMLNSMSMGHHHQQNQFGGDMGMGMGMGENYMDPMSMMRAPSASSRDGLDEISSLMSPNGGHQDASASLSDSQNLLALQRQQQMLMMQTQQLQQQSQKFESAPYMGPEDEEEEPAGGGNVNAYLAAQNAMMKRQMAELVRNQQKLKMLQDATKKAKAEAMGAQKELFGGMTQSMNSDYDNMPAMSTERSIAQQTALLQQQQQQLLQMQSQFAAATGNGGGNDMMGMSGAMGGGMGGMSMAGMGGGGGMGNMMDDDDMDMPSNLSMKQQQQLMRQKQQNDMARLEQMRMLQSRMNNGGGSNGQGSNQGQRNKERHSFSKRSPAA